MPDTYRATFHARREAAVEITVPDTAEPLDYLAHEIARELDLMRFEIQIGSEGGHIRRLGDDGPGIAFSLGRTPSPDDASAICADLRRQSDFYTDNPRVDARPDDEDQE